MSWELLGGTAVITGAASGIGRALANRLAQEKIPLALVDLDTAGLEETAGQLAGAQQPISTHIVNIADAKAMSQLTEDVASRHSRVSLLINNAGVVLLGSAAEVSLEEFDWLMRINFWGVVHGVKYFLPILQREPRAHIVNVSSLYGLVGKADYSAYCASKFAVRGFTEALRQELQGSSVGVSCAYPGLVRTQFAKRARIAKASEDRADLQANRQNATAGRTSAEMAAERIIEGIKKRKARILIGSDVEMWDRLQRASPSNYDRSLNLLRKLRG